MMRLVVLLGPTAVGKSEVGLALAEHFGGEILSADALQIYRGFDVGTAKPSPAEQRRVRHHLIDICEPSERFSAGRFARLGRQAILEIRSRRALPIVLGGSGLYLRALLDGMTPIPAANPRVRQQLEQELAQQGLPALRQRLLDLDPVTARRLEPGDTQRTLRALEVVLSSGRPLSEWIAERPFGGDPLQARKIGLTLPRGVLYDRIARRVRSMIQSGWVEEVEELLRRGLHTSLPAFQAIGYRQLAAYLQGKRTLDAAVEEIIRSTTRYAKRQTTWFRREPDVAWFRPDDLKATVDTIVSLLDPEELGVANGKSEH